MPGIPSGCGPTMLAPSTINLSSYCNNGEYKGNQPSLLADNIPSSSDSTPQIEKENAIDDELITKVYPNPSSDGVFNLAIISSKFEQEVSIWISDATGRDIFQSKNTILQYDEIKIDLSSQPPGIFFIQVIDKDGNRYYEKLIIE